MLCVSACSRSPHMGVISLDQLGSLGSTRSPLSCHPWVLASSGEVDLTDKARNALMPDLGVARKQRPPIYR